MTNEEYHYLWDELHNRSKIANLETEIEWLNKFGEFLACDSCREHWAKAIKKRPPDLSNQLAYARWTWKIHNDINISLGRTVFPWRDAQRKYGWWK